MAIDAAASVAVALAHRARFDSIACVPLDRVPSRTVERHLQGPRVGSIVGVVESTVNRSNHDRIVERERHPSGTGSVRVRGVVVVDSCAQHDRVLRGALDAGSRERLGERHGIGRRVAKLLESRRQLLVLALAPFGEELDLLSEREHLLGERLLPREAELQRPKQRQHAIILLEHGFELLAGDKVVERRRLSR